MTVQLFSVPVFLIVFRETLETAIITSVLLAFLKQTIGGPHADKQVYKKLRRQVWLGVGLGLIISLIIAGVLIGVFYKVGVDAWSKHEMDYEGAFSLIASIIITIMGAALLRIGKLQEKWRVKLAKAAEAPLKNTTRLTGTEGPQRGVWAKSKAYFKAFCQKYAMFVLPFVTVLREAIEAIVFIAGVTFSAPGSSVPIPVVVGLAAGCAVGYALYKTGSSTSLKFFLIASSCLLYLVAAGLFSRAVWFFEMQKWNTAVGGDAAETGAGPGSYDIAKSVWHVNCCSPYYNGGGGWGVFNAILGWQNSATYGSVISYNIYWIFVMIGFGCMRYHELKGHWPLMKGKVSRKAAATESTA